MGSEFWILLTLALGAAVAVLAFMLTGMRKATSEIAKGVRRRLRGKSGALVGISSRDATMRDLANSLNEALTTLHDARCRYERGDQRVRDALANVAHDLRTPLTAILGYVDLAKVETDPQELHACIDVVGRRAAEMRTLIEDLFEYSLSASRAEGSLPLSDISIRDLLAASIADAYPLFQESGTQPVILLPEDPATCRANRDAAARVFGNLIVNALRHGTGDLTITASEDGGVYFTNPAPSMDPVDVEHLFDRFYTVRGTGQSTGLGLSIARSLMEEMGGSLTGFAESGKLTVVVRFARCES